MVSSFQKGDEAYKKLPAGKEGRWKFVSRIDTENAVCLVSRIMDQKEPCMQIIRTKSSNSKGIFDHALKKHNVDIDVILSQKKEEFAESLARFLKKRKFNEIWDFESAIARLACEDGASLNFIKNSYVINNFFQKTFKKNLPNQEGIRKIIIKHFETIKNIIKTEIKNNLQNNLVPNFIFDEWTTKSTIQCISLTVNFPGSCFNLGLIELTGGSATASNIGKHLFDRLHEYGLSKNMCKVITADGASTNSKL